MMKINKEKIDKLIGKFKRCKLELLAGTLCHPKFKIYITKDGNKIITARIGNKQGWYAIVCFHDDFRVDILDRHVFDRYSERFLKNKNLSEDDIITTFIYRGNCSGTLAIDENDEFQKRIEDGICFGEISENDTIMYHKTFITKEMAISSQHVLLDLC